MNFRLWKLLLLILIPVIAKPQEVTKRDSNYVWLNSFENIQKNINKNDSIKHVAKQKALREAFKQDSVKQIAIKNAKNVLHQKDSSWTNSLQAGINANQATFSDNWKGGGINAIALGAFFNGKRNYRQNKLHFENEFQSQYGVVKNGGQTFKKNADRIFFDSKLGYNLTPHGRLSMFLSINFISQFGNGFNYMKDSLGHEKGFLISSFFSPAYLTTSTGFEYRPIEYFWLRFGTGSLRQTFVLDTTLYHLQPQNYGVPIGKRVRNEVAFQLIADFDKQIAKSLYLKARYMAFANYRTLNSIDSRIDISFTAKVNKFINVNLTGVIMYDQDMDYKIQYSQALTLSILYSYSEFKP